MDNPVSLRIGFELECIVPIIKLPSFRRSLSLIGRRYGQKIDTIPDSSICCYTKEKDVEIITQPLAFGLAVQILNDCAALIAKYGRTNSTCGLHVNISFRGMSMHKLSMLHDLEGVKRQWKREKNFYCTLQEALRSRCTSDFELKSALENGHFVAVRLRKGDYYEFRVIGGRDYHRKMKAARANVVQFCQWLGWDKPLQ